MKPCYFFYIFCFGRDQINTCRFDAAVAHNVCQAYYISTQTVKTPCKKMSEIVRKNFSAQNACMPAKSFHVGPYLLAAQGAAVFAQKNLSCFYAEFSHVYPELFAKFVRDQDGPDAFSAKFRTVIFAAEYAYFNTVDCMFLLGKRCFSLQFAFRKFRSLRKRYA